MPAQKAAAPASSAPPARPRPLRWVLPIILLGALAAAGVLAQGGSVYRLRRTVLSGGGGAAAGSAYRLNYSLGQPATVGCSAGSAYRMRQGYWRAVGPAPTPTPVPTAGPTPTPTLTPTPTQLPFPTPFVQPLAARAPVQSLFDHTNPAVAPVPNGHLTIYTGAAVDNDPPPDDDCCWWVDNVHVCVYKDEGETWTDLRWDQDVHPCGTGGAGWLAYDGHGGYDISCDDGTPVNAAGEGQAHHIGDSGIYINHGWESYRTYYFHMDSFAVDDGADVVPGQRIGTAGSAAHLHLELRHFVDDDWQLVDPYGWAGDYQDPWAYNVGNLWLTGEPIPMGYVNQNNARDPNSPFALTDPDIRAEWLLRAAALGSPVDNVLRDDGPCQAGFAPEGYRQYFERGYIYRCVDPPIPATTVLHPYRCHIDVHASKDAGDPHNTTFTVRNVGGAPAQVNVTFYTADGRVLDSRTYRQLPVGGSWDVNVRTYLYAVFLQRTYYAPVFDGPAVVVSSQPLDAPCLEKAFLPVAYQEYAQPLGAASSYYVSDLSAPAMYDQGCAAGTAGRGDVFVLLDFGRPWADGTTAGTWLYNDTYVATAQIAVAAAEFLRGYWNCAADSPPALLTLGLGTSNRGVFVTAEHGAAWGALVHAVAAWADAQSYRARIAVAGAWDVDPAALTAADTRAWSAAYGAAAGGAPLYNVGAAADCVPGGACPPGWTPADLYDLSWGAAWAYVVPQVYTRDGAQARQWVALSRFGQSAYGARIHFSGALTQQEACRQGGCLPATDNSPAQGWRQLWAAAYHDPNTRLTQLPWSPDLRRDMP